MTFMKVKAYQGAGLVLGLLLLFVGTCPVEAQGSAVVSLQPATMSLAAGESGLMTIAIEQANDLFGYELHLEFNPAVMQIIDANPGQPGVQIQPAGFIDESRGFAVANRVDNGLGKLDYAMTLLAPTEPVSGAGPLLELGVRAVAPGNSPLTLSVILASSDGLALPVETIDGNLAVTGNQPPGGTPLGTTVAVTPVIPTATIKRPTSPAAVTPTVVSGGNVPRESTGESSEAGVSVNPSRRSGNDNPQGLPAANALQTVTALESAVPTSAGSLAPTATQEGALSSEPDEFSSGEEVAMVQSGSPGVGAAITGDERASDPAETGAGWSPLTIGLLAGAALIILAGVLYGRRLLVKK